MRRLLFLLLIVLVGCTGPTAPALPTDSAVVDTPTLPAPTSPAAATAQPSASPEPSATTPPLPRLCTPLQGYPLDVLGGMAVNPYAPPAPGSDLPHHGVDLAVVLPNTDIAVKGHPVQSALEGVVAAVIRDRFPYGNALLIETPLETQPQDWWLPLELPAPAATLAPNPSLTCPPGPAFQPEDLDRRSLYILYAHLADPPALAVDSGVTCGQQIGTVGDSGNALAPHLHFEIRVGPSGLRLDSMAHYHASASEAEMRSYCLWRVSGMFALVDPARLFTLPR